MSECPNISEDKFSHYSHVLHNDISVDDGWAAYDSGPIRF